VGATIIPLVFAWNGSLMRSLGRDGFSGPVLSYFFPGLTFIPGDSPSDLGRLRDVASRNIAIAWVRPEGDNLTLDLPGHSLYFQTTHTGNRLVELNLIMFGGPPQSPGTAP
jgi:hypothetical protein